MQLCASRWRLISAIRAAVGAAVMVRPSLKNDVCGPYEALVAIVESGHFEYCMNRRVLTTGTESEIVFYGCHYSAALIQYQDRYRACRWRGRAQYVGDIYCSTFVAAALRLYMDTR